MKLKVPKRAPVLVAASVIALICAAQIARFDFLERLERMTYDWRARRAAQHSPVVATNLGFVSISDQTIEAVNNGSLGYRYGLYWPRHLYGRVARELAVQGASVSAFDVLLAELRADHNPVLIVGEKEPVDSDVYFARLIRRAGNVLLAAEPGSLPPSLFATNALAIGDISADKDSDGILRRAKAFQNYRKWHFLFEKLANDPDYGVDLRKARVMPGRIVLPRSEGDAIVIPVDAQGRFDAADFVGEKLPAGMDRHPKAFTEERVWHMGIMLAALELKLDLARAEVDLPHGKIKLRGEGGLERVIPVDANGYFYINWAMTENDPRMTRDSFENLLRLDREHEHGVTDYLGGNSSKWKGKLAIIGSSALGNDLTDRGATPLEEHALLVSKHWNVASSVITGRFIHRASLPVELLLICLMGALVTVAACTRRVLIATAWVGVASVLYVWLAQFVFAKFGHWLPVVLPVAGGLLATHGVLLAYLVVFEQGEQRRVKTVFNKVVSPDVVTELLKSDNLALSGARRSVTVLFADIRGFTEMADINRDKAAEYIKQHGLVGDAAEAIFDVQARETLDTVNRYLKVIAETVIRHQGTIDKFIGDCVMAFWGAPNQNSQHALDCVRAAIDVQRAVYKLNRERDDENKQRETENIRRTLAGERTLPMLPILSVGCGINTGVVTVGLMGSDMQLNYTVFGRDVNLASRLETVSGRGRIIISESTLAEIIQDDSALALSCLELPAVNVKGIREAVRIYEVPWRTSEYGLGTETAPPFKMPGYDTGSIAKTDQAGV